jgi:hypothetical protein
MDNIKKSVEALKSTTDGFVEIGLQTNGNGTVTTTTFTEQEPSINEGYLGKFTTPHQPRSPTTLSQRAQQSFNRMQAKIRQQQNTNGGRRSRHHRTRRNSKKTRRAKRHSRHRTRRV